MDYYFKPILISTLVVILLNTLFIVPLSWWPILTYLLGGSIAVLLFKRGLKDNYQEVRAWDAVILGLGTGVVVGGILTIILCIKLQDVNIQNMLIDAINESMRMHSRAEFRAIESLSSAFYVITGILTMIVCGLISLFGSLGTLAFVNKAKK